MTDRTCKILAGVLAPFAFAFVVAVFLVFGTALLWIMKLPYIGIVVMVVFFGLFTFCCSYGFWELLQESCIKYWRGKEN